ncbi:TPA: hypothetical protein F8S02_02300 [Legionella pneumophila]|uniref:hypothetical protein n=1 Tax=Legionella pneumophila TaxID=446 RepID=UPI00048085D0|nr:hypothetical protein [Legionella pneumophila]SNV20283.1 Uncharacterised protein [Legionella pneumophila]HAT8692494.1 hypothetical protein [Legionella pneumophila]HAU1215341.1 hypothetical protein [Legionella pneumophila]
MKPFGFANEQISRELNERETLLRYTVKQANQKYGCGLLSEAKKLFRDSQRLALYVNSGLKIIVQNEESDFILHRQLGQRIKKIDSLLGLI